MHREQATQRAVVLEKLGSHGEATLAVRDVPPKLPGPGQVVVALRAAALNRRDLWIRLGKYAGIKLPCVLGSDGVGVVTRVGAGTEGRWLGQDVLINPSLAWGPSEATFGKDFAVLGMPDEGTFADEIVVHESQLAETPAHLTVHEAAALPLAGLTAYRALCVRGALRAGETVIVPGIGSGVSSMVLVLAKYLGARVAVTSSSEAKRQRARELGADLAVDHRDPSWGKAVLAFTQGQGADLVVDGAGGETWSTCVGLLRAGGRLVSYGATAGVASLDLRRLFWKQLTLVGSTMGSPRDFAELLAICAAGKLRPLVDQVLPLAAADEALARMERGEHMGKIVLDMKR